MFKPNLTDRGTRLDNANNPTQVSYPQVDMHTLEQNIVSNVRSEVDCAMTRVKNKVKDAALTAMEILVVPRVELAMKSTNATSGRSVIGNVLEPDQKDFLRNIERLQTFVSSRKNSRTDLSGIDETRGETATQRVCLFVNGRNIDQQTDTHHMLIGESYPQEIPKIFFGHIPTHREPTLPQHMIRQL